MTKRVVVEGDYQQGRPVGSITWEEHLEAWNVYNNKSPFILDAMTIAQRGGFAYKELCRHLGHEPTTWKPTNKLDRFEN